jgi:glycosyltransferase involved in cell wall biosynthesis
MKKICFITDSVFSIGGVQRVTAVIAEELAKDYDVTIVTFDTKEQKDISLYGMSEANIQYRFFTYPNTGKFKRLLCKVYSGFYLKMQLQGKLWSDLYAHSSFPSELRNTLVAELKLGNYDVIIGVHAPLAARLATICKHFPNTKLIGWIHNSFEALFSKDSLYIGTDRKRHYVYQFTKLDKTVLLCNHDAETYYQYDKEFKPVVIYDPLTLKPGEPSQGTSKRFLAVGRFSRQHKGFDLLIKAFHLFAQKNIEWKLDIVGEGPEEGLYRELISKYKLEDRIEIHPFTNNIQSYYSNAQIYVLSSRWEGFGLVLVEAMAHGLPVISSDLPTSVEIMGDFGLYFKNGDIQELAKRLEDATQIDWQTKSKEAIDITRKYDIKQIVNQWKALIEG